MIPAKVFMEGVDTSSNPFPKLKINLILNSIFYNQIKQFQTRYLCVTTQDVLTIQVTTCESNALFGQATIDQLHKVILDRQTVVIQIVGDSQFVGKHINIRLSFEPVAAFSRIKGLGASTKRTEQVLIRQQICAEMQGQFIDMSFSQRSPLRQSNLQTLRSHQGLQKSQKANLFLQNLGLQQGQSLQSLALQREKILGQLFGKFKRDR